MPEKCPGFSIEVKIVEFNTKCAATTVVHFKQEAKENGQLFAHFPTSKEAKDMNGRHAERGPGRQI